MLLLCFSCFLLSRTLWLLFTGIKDSNVMLICCLVMSFCSFSNEVMLVWGFGYASQWLVILHQGFGHVFQVMPSSLCLVLIVMPFRGFVIPFSGPVIHHFFIRLFL